MKTDMQQTYFFSDKFTNEQQVWVTMLSLQYSFFLLPFFSDKPTNERQVWVTVPSLQCLFLLEISSSWCFILCSWGHVGDGLV